VARLMAPILSFTAEEVWASVSGGQRPPSVFLSGFPEPPARDAALAAKWERLLEVRSAVTKALETARQAGVIGHSLDALVSLAPANGLRPLLEGEAATLPALLIVSQVQLRGDLEDTMPSALLEDLKIRVEPARGGKCERCWNYRESVGRDATHPGLCDRCVRVVNV